MSMREEPNEVLDVLIEESFESGEEIHVEMDTATEAAWAGQLRWIPRPNSHGEPDVSVNVYVAGKPGPQELIEALVEGYRHLRHDELREAMRYS